MFRIYDNKGCLKKYFEVLNQKQILPIFLKEVEDLIDKNKNVLKKYFDNVKIKNLKKNYLQLFYIADFLDKFKYDIENLKQHNMYLDEDDLKLNLILNKYYRKVVDLTSKDKELSTLLSSMILNEILDFFNLKINESINNFDKDSNILLFSAHDTTMSALLKVLGEDVDNYNLHYNDEITFILYKDFEDGIVKIKLLYNENKVNMSLNNLKLNETSYNVFKKSLSSNLFNKTDIEEFCFIDTNTLKNTSENSNSDKIIHTNNEL